MGANKINMFFDHLLVKEPGAVEPTPWHQDGPYWKIKGEQIYSIWFAMDHVTENTGGVRYVKGSHATGVRYRPQSFSDDVVWDPRKGTTDVLRDPGLKSGSPLDSTLFPIVWKK